MKVLYSMLHGGVIKSVVLTPNFNILDNLKGGVK